MSKGARLSLMRDGVWMRPSAYGPDPYPITRGLIEDGRRHLLMGGEIPIECPVRILHGLADRDVPWRHGLRLMELLRSADVEFVLVKNGDHRLSDPASLARIVGLVEGMG
jgi:pimeloyl-ACP methyl ester carboxylesterase